MSSISEMIEKLFGSTFHFHEDTFDAVAAAVCLVAIVEAESVERVLEHSRIIDEERCISHTMALLKLAEKLPRLSLVWGKKGPNAEKFVGLEVNRGEQPIPLIEENDSSTSSASSVHRSFRSNVSGLTSTRRSLMDSVFP